MASTTIKVSVETRNRIKMFGGATHEETIARALDLLDDQQFWQQAEAAKVFHDSLSDSEKARRAAEVAEVDAAFDSIDG